MARKKIVVDAVALQGAIDQVESKRPHKNLSKLFAAVAKTPWAKSEGLTASVIGLRYKEFGLTSKTTPGRTISPKPSSEQGVNTSGALDGLIAHFKAHGIVVESPSDIITSAYKDADLNAKIRHAWSAARKTFNCPLP